MPKESWGLVWNASTCFSRRKSGIFLTWSEIFLGKAHYHGGGKLRKGRIAVLRGLDTFAGLLCNFAYNDGGRVGMGLKIGG
jgi:hypothetical protein